MVKLVEFSCDGKSTDSYLPILSVNSTILVRRFVFNKQATIPSRFLMTKNYQRFDCMLIWTAFIQKKQMHNFIKNYWFDWFLRLNFSELKVKLSLSRGKVHAVMARRTRE